MSELHDLMAQHLRNVFAGLDDPHEEEANNFEREAAIYWFANNYHGGQFCELYKVLSESEFRPGPTHRSVKDEGEQAEMYYDELVKTFGPQTSRERAKRGFRDESKHRELTPAKWTLKEAKRVLKDLGMTISKKDGEYRVNYRDGKESTAYYTDGLDDAVATGKLMAKELAR